MSSSSPPAPLRPSPWPLPTTANVVANFDAEQISLDAHSTKVILHPRLSALISSYLDFKRTHGPPLEQAPYTSISMEDLVARLITQRPLHFTNQYNYTALRDGTELLGREEWLRVGTTDEHYDKHIKLAKYLSYDEMMIASLLGMSGPSYFINGGKRDNCAVPGDRGTFEIRGIMVGLVGARFQCPGHMDAALCLPPDREQPKYLQDLRLTKIF